MVKKVKEKTEKKFKCKYCGLIFDSEKELDEHVENECVGKLIHQRTSIIGKLEKFMEKIKPNGDKDVYDIKKGIEVLKKMEEIRKDGKIPVIKLKSVKQAKELKKVIDFRGEIIYTDNNQRDFLNYVIGLKPKLVIGKFSDKDEKIFKLNKIDYASQDILKVEIKDTCGALSPEDLSKIFSNREVKKIKKGPELKLVLDLSLVDETGGKKKVFRAGKLAVPLIEKKLEELEKKMNGEEIEKNLERIEEGLEKSELSETEKVSENQEPTTEQTQPKEIKKEHNLAEELNLINLKEDFLKVEKKEEKKEKKESLFSSIVKKKEKKVKKTLKEAALENLSKSKEIEDYDKATVLVAHVLKQFLEIKMECQKELTYMELVEKLKTFHLPLDYIDEIIQFYKNMHIQEYKDEVRVNFQEAYELAERVINDLA